MLLKSMKKNQMLKPPTDHPSILKPEFNTIFTINIICSITTTPQWRSPKKKWTFSPTVKSLNWPLCTRTRPRPAIWRQKTVTATKQQDQTKYSGSTKKANGKDWSAQQQTKKKTKHKHTHGSKTGWHDECSGHRFQLHGNKHTHVTMQADEAVIPWSIHSRRGQTNTQRRWQ